MRSLLLQFRDFFVSLRLTVVLLALSIVLVFVATLDQVNLGVWAVQEKYFRSFFVHWTVGNFPVPVFPGGYLIGGLLFINLVAAHFYRFKMRWRKAGIFLTHIGLLMLLLGELFSGLWQQDFQMTLREGQTLNYAESFQDNELAIVDVTDPKVDDVVAIPESLLARGRTIQNPKLPFSVVTKGYYQNAFLQMRSNVPNSPPAVATIGIGAEVLATPVAPTYKSDERNVPAAYVELIGPGGSLGTLLVSPNLTPETFTYGDRKFSIGMRITRQYEPFSLTLLQVRHDVYPGTDIPKNFSSRVKINTPNGADDREVLIYMNNPLRYSGLTFYQYQMNAANQLSVLQVVRNPSWLVPYIACILMAVGLVVQFSISLAAFFRKRRKAAMAATPAAT